VVPLCSTPFGIRGRNALWAIYSIKEAEGGAQRLSASEEETRNLTALDSDGYAVLNAFRHQRKKR